MQKQLRTSLKSSAKPYAPKTAAETSSSTEGCDSTSDIDASAAQRTEEILGESDMQLDYPLDVQTVKAEPIGCFFEMPMEKQSNEPPLASAATLPEVLEASLPAKNMSTVDAPRIIQGSVLVVKQEAKKQSNSKSNIQLELQQKAKGKKKGFVQISKKGKHKDSTCDHCFDFDTFIVPSRGLFASMLMFLAKINSAILLIYVIDYVCLGGYLDFHGGVETLSSGLVDLCTGRTMLPQKVPSLPEASSFDKRSNGQSRGELKPLSSKCNCQDEHAWRDEDGDSCWVYRAYIDNGIVSRKEACEIGSMAKEHCKRTCRICTCKGDDMDMDKLMEPTRESLMALYQVAIQHPDGVEENADASLIQAAEMVARQEGYAPIGNGD